MFGFHKIDCSVDEFFLLLLFEDVSSHECLYIGGILLGCDGCGLGL